MSQDGSATGATGATALWMSCDIVEDHNIEFQAKFKQEGEFEQECAEIDEADRRFPLE